VIVLVFLGESDEKNISIIKDMNDFFCKRNKEAIFGNTTDAIGTQSIPFFFFVVLMQNRKIGFEDERQGFANSDSDWYGSDESNVSACLNRHLYLLQNHQQ